MTVRAYGSDEYGDGLYGSGDVCQRFPVFVVPTVGPLDVRVPVPVLDIEVCEDA